MVYSFSAAAKAEIAKVFPQKRCCAIAEAFGILLLCSSFSYDGIRIITESRELSQMLPRLFMKAFQVDFDQMPSSEETGKMIFQISLDIIRHPSSIGSITLARDLHCFQNSRCNLVLIVQSNTSVTLDNTVNHRKTPFFP